MTGLPSANGHASHWAAEYIGIPFRDGGRDRAGLDCWGLVRLVLLERFGIEVPGLDGISSGASGEERVAGVVVAALPVWREIARGDEQPGDVVLLRLKGWPIHVGVVVMHGVMLHAIAGCDSCVERYAAPVWTRRVVGIYRWRGVPA
jgi:cell wall-associated NlpC family hydrolase